MHPKFAHPHFECGVYLERGDDSCASPCVGELSSLRCRPVANLRPCMLRSFCKISAVLNKKRLIPSENNLQRYRLVRRRKICYPVLESIFRSKLNFSYDFG